jgi:hypothetical protein
MISEWLGAKIKCVHRSVHRKFTNHQQVFHSFDRSR